MKQLIILLFIFFIAFNANAQDHEWLTNLENAEKTSSQNDQYILLNFSGSDWCGNCMRLEKDLFLSEDFIKFADENLVLLNLDFPAKKANKLSEEQTAYNDKLAEKYNKKGIFPLTLILNSEGEIVGEMAYPSKSVAEYIASIQSMIK